MVVCNLTGSRFYMPKTYKTVYDSTIRIKCAGFAWKIFDRYLPFNTHCLNDKVERFEKH